MGMVNHVKVWRVDQGEARQPIIWVFVDAYFIGIIASLVIALVPNFLNEPRRKATIQWSDTSRTSQIALGHLRGNLVIGFGISLLSTKTNEMFLIRSERLRRLTFGMGKA